MKINNYIVLYTRDLNRLIDELKSYHDEDAIWEVLPGTINSAGNLVQHLIGNLKTYIGNPFGNLRYVRDREAEFAARLFTRDEMVQTLEELIETVAFSLSKIPDDAMDAVYPREILSIHPDQTIEYVLVHLAAHLSYHLGQINYQRRFIVQI